MYKTIELNLYKKNVLKFKFLLNKIIFFLQLLLWQ